MLNHKYISIILHPIVIPTIGVMLYFLAIPNIFLKEQKYTVLSFVFITTYLIPLFMLIFFKKIKLIVDYNLRTIRERKIPVIFMISLFFILSISINKIILLRDLSLLFLSTSLGLLILLIFLFLKIKISIHLFSLGISIGFFLFLTQQYQQSFLIIIIGLILLSGFLASSRLNLKAHTLKEIYAGWFLGIVSVLITGFLL